MISEHFNQIYEKWHECGGAALDPNFNLDEDFLRHTSEIDYTGEIKAVYERYKDFIQAQLVDIGFCKKAHIDNIVSQSKYNFPNRAILKNHQLKILFIF